MKYTITQQGQAWIASNGKDHVEAEYPDDALHLLLNGEAGKEFGINLEEMSRSDRSFWSQDAVGLAAVRLIRLLALDAPAEVLRNTLGTIAKHIDLIISLREDA